MTLAQLKTHWLKPKHSIHCTTYFFSLPISFALFLSLSHSFPQFITIKWYYWYVCGQWSQFLRISQCSKWAQMRECIVSFFQRLFFEEIRPFIWLIGLCYGQFLCLINAFVGKGIWHASANYWPLKVMCSCASHHFHLTIRITLFFTT